jgi:FdhD protein
MNVRKNHMKAFDNIRILRIKDGSAEDVEDIVAVEKRVRILVNGMPALSLYCTPLMVREFVVGVIHNEGLISGEWCAERISIEYGEEIVVDVPSTGSLNEGERTITSGCGGGVSLSTETPGKISDDASFEAETIRNIFGDFQKKSEGYRTTGGVHSAAITDSVHILAFAEDIGRHNAVDKVIGYCLLENIPFEGKMMLASGRLSSEIVSKCARSRIPVLVSRSAPTSLAVTIAAATGQTLIGFVRGNRMNVYAGRQRIVL